jgi:hypothetical protein
MNEILKLIESYNLGLEARVEVRPHHAIEMETIIDPLH